MALSRQDIQPRVNGFSSLCTCSMSVLRQQKDTFCHFCTFSTLPEAWGSLPADFAGDHRAVMCHYFVSVLSCLCFTPGLARNAFRSFCHVIRRIEVAHISPCERGPALVQPQRTAIGGRDASMSACMARATVQESSLHGSPMSGGQSTLANACKRQEQMSRLAAGVVCAIL